MKYINLKNKAWIWKALLKLNSNNIPGPPSALMALKQHFIYRYNINGWAFSQMDPRAHRTEGQLLIAYTHTAQNRSQNTPLREFYTSK